MAVLTIARLTLREASRRRLVIAVAVLIIVVGFLSAWGFHRLMEVPCGEAGHLHRCAASEHKLLAATLLILLMFMFSFILALGAAFIGAPTVAGEVESGVMLAMLPRPIRRSDVVLGKWLGLSLFIGLYATLACGLEFIIVRIAMGYVPPNPVLVIAFVIAEAIVVLTLTMAGSTRVPAMTCGIVVLILFGMTWIGGIAGTVGASFHSRPIETVGTVSSLVFPTDGLWRGAVYYLEPVTVILAQEAAGDVASGNPFFVTSPPTTPYLLWSLGWVAVVLGLASWSFSRREL